MAGNVVYEYRIIETAKGFRIEIEGDEEHLHKVLGHGMGLGHGHGPGGHPYMPGSCHGKGHGPKHKHGMAHGHDVAPGHGMKGHGSSSFFHGHPHSPECADDAEEG